MHFKNLRSKHNFNSRAKYQLVLPMVNRDFGKNTFRFSEAKKYNSLLKGIRTFEALGCFSRHARNLYCRKYLVFSNC